jgi:hypothetical protein
MRARHFVAGGTIALATFSLALAASPATAAEGDAQLSVLHGVPDLTVDVWVDGELTLDDFAPGDLAGPLALPAGTYSVAITAADAADDSDPAIGPVDLELASGGSYTAVAHLDADAQPTATLFTNDVTATAAGEGRITVRHVAAAPGVDVLAGGEAVISGLENPDEQVLDLPAGTVSASVVAAGTTEPALLGPADVDVAEGTNTILYAWGDATADPSTLALATQVIDGLHGDPEGVQAGELGLAADAQGSSWLWAAGALVVAGALGTGLALRRSPARDDVERR